MTNQNDGGRAFPAAPHYECIGDTQHFYEGSYGMSLRDYFAAKALAYICHFNILATAMNEAECADQITNAAALSYRLADAMLAERERPPIRSPKEIQDRHLAQFGK